MRDTLKELKNRHVDIVVKQKLGRILKFLKSEYNS